MRRYGPSGAAISPSLVEREAKRTERMVIGWLVSRDVLAVCVMCHVNAAVGLFSVSRVKCRCCFPCIDVHEEVDYMRQMAGFRIQGPVHL